MRKRPDTKLPDVEQSGAQEPEAEEEGLQSRVLIKKDNRRREAKGWVISLVAAVVIALVLRFFVFEFIRVDGPSMEPTLYTDEYVFTEKVTYWFGGPQRGDIIICSFPGSSASYVKRVIGLPGERIKVEDGVLYIDGIPNYDYFTGYIDESMDEMTVPEESVIVMGDNRNESRDSRSVGPIAYKDILGRTLFVIWPPDKMHGLK